MRSEETGGSSENRRLKACIRDLICISAIPAISQGLQPRQLLETLFDVLLSTLSLDLAYGELRLDSAGEKITLVRSAREKALSELPSSLRVAVDSWLEDQSRTSPHAVGVQSAGGRFFIAMMGLGPSAELGWMLVCTRRKDFPNQTERLLLRVASNQAIISLQQAQLLRQQILLSRKLDLKVKRKANELQVTNRELQQALKQIGALRDVLQRENIELRERAATARGGLSPGQLQRAQDLMIESLKARVPLARLARECGLSERHFARAFRQSTGLPPHRWLVDHKVERAKQLLPNPLLSLSDVARTCGFADQSHFSRMFSALVGLSPGLWRRLNPDPAISGTPRPRSR